MGKLFISGIIPSTRANVDISDVNEKILKLYKKNNFEFIEHPQITTDYLWNDVIHLQDTGKSLTCQKLINRVSRFLSELTSWYNSNSSSTEPPFSSSQNDSLDAKAKLTEMKSQSPDKVILGLLNINSIQNKFDGLKYVIDNKIHIFLISKTKLDDSFLTAQFLIEGFGTPYR